MWKWIHNFIQLSVGNIGVIPTYYLRIDSGGKIQSQNTGYFNRVAQLTLTNSTVNDPINTVIVDTLRLLTVTSLTPQTISISGFYVALTGYSISSAVQKYYVTFSLIIQLPASYSGTITIKSTTASYTITLPNIFTNSSVISTITVTIFGSTI